MARAVLYFALLAWCFLGVAIISDVFMTAIETITSRREVRLLHCGREVVVKSWNATVANLSLMALGSSAPEILLSVIETIGDNFYSGDLGPSTIVGSAAFNLLVIIAVCVFVIPVGESRTIKQLGPYFVTASFSVLAYVWLIIILAIISPDVVEVWEGVLTFCFFPLLVVIAYMADIGMLCRFQSSQQDEAAQLLRQQAEDNGIRMTISDAKVLSNSAAQDDVEQIRARKASHSRGIAVQFAASKYCFGSQDKSLMLEVEKVGRLASRHNVFVKFCTRDGTMESGRGDYPHTTGTVELPGRETHGKIQIMMDVGKMPLKLDVKGDSYFFVEITGASCVKANKKTDEVDMTQELSAAVRHTTKVVVSDTDTEDTPGEITFLNGQVEYASQSVDHIIPVAVHRIKGSTGQISCKYTTESGSAMEGFDFVACNGTLTFPPGSVQQEIEITLKKKHAYQAKESFYVRLSNDDGCADVVAEAGAEICVVILPLNLYAGKVGQIVRLMDQGINFDACKRGHRRWADQFRDARRPGVQDAEEADAKDWAIHFVALPWKLMVAMVPPETYCGGWLCFFIALAFIGFVTAIIKDLASLFGCVVSMPDTITAITIVALGTSLPDLFASLSAAVEDPIADNAIGNVTGSNGVNVFLGLGLPWMLASIYWWKNDATDEWRQKYPLIAQAHPEGVFVVPQKDLVYSVLVFTLCAILALGTLWFRRVNFNAELGGPLGMKMNTSIFFILLWICYMGLASWKSLMGEVSTSLQVLAILGGFAVTIFAVIALSFLLMFLRPTKEAQEANNCIYENRPCPQENGGVNVDRLPELVTLLRKQADELEAFYAGRQAPMCSRRKKKRKKGSKAPLLPDVSRESKASSSSQSSSEIEPLARPTLVDTE